ncbi:MAG: hypothetical protein AABW45_02850 [Nanoarchaeota archaeon]
MVTIEDIIKKLEELESNEDRLEYLNSILDEIEDDELKENIKEIIKKLEDSLETKLEMQDTPSLRKIAREMDFDEAELDVEQIQRNTQQRNARPDLTIRQSEDNEANFSYSSNNNYSNTQLYSQGLFDYQTLQGSSNLDLVKQNLVRENILNPESPSTELERENLSKKLRESMPGMSEENLLIYQNKISTELKKDEKAKYIARLK